MNFSDQLKTQLDIVEVVGQYVRLKRQGAGPRWVGLCPFHSEKTPSFGVHSGHQYYKCFGCDAAGDVLKFVQQIESLTFPETLRLLSDRYNIPMPERAHHSDGEAKRFAALLEMHEAAASLFQENLRSASGGAAARGYLQQRGVSADAIREFRLGLSDSGGQQLVERLRPFGEQLLLESGLAAKREERSGLYDRFRGRLMFPIHDAAGKVIAFGGRSLRADDKVKYLNSPETRLYSKSAVLFNMHRAKVAARKADRMILVEGYMDAIAVYSAGIQEVAAICGTALSATQIRALKREISYQSGKGHVVLNLDSDAAGSRSTEKHIGPLLAHSLRVKVLEIPGDLDPDEYLAQHGSEAYGKLLGQAPSYFHWLTAAARNKFDMRTAEGKIDAFQSLLPSLEHVSDRIERSTIAAEIASQLGVERETVQHALQRKGSASLLPARPRDPASAVAPNEKLLLACMLASAGAREVIRHYFSSAAQLDGLELKPIFEAMLAHGVPDEGFALGRVIERLDEHFAQILTAISFAESAIPEEQAAQQALDCLKHLESKSLARSRDALRRQIRECELAGKMEDALRLMMELDGLAKPSATG